jgi:hypothetical protein
MEIGMHPNSNRTKVCVSSRFMLETPGAQIFDGIFFFFGPWLIDTLYVPIIICSSTRVLHQNCHSAGAAHLVSPDVNVNVHPSSTFYSI